MLCYAVFSSIRQELAAIWPCAVRNLQVAVESEWVRRFRASRRLIRETGSNPEVENEPRLLTVSQAAAYLSTTVPAIRALKYSRELPFIRIGKRDNFDRKDLDTFIEARKRTC
jgi:excisionase family DNA binding protein